MNGTVEVGGGMNGLVEGWCGHKDRMRRRIPVVARAAEVQELLKRYSYSSQDE